MTRTANEVFPGIYTLKKRGRGEQSKIPQKEDLPSNREERPPPNDYSIVFIVLNIRYRLFIDRQNYIQDTRYRVIYRNMLLNIGRQIVHHTR